LERESFFLVSFFPLKNGSTYSSRGWGALFCSLLVAREVSRSCSCSRAQQRHRGLLRAQERERERERKREREKERERDIRSREQNDQRSGVEHCPRFGPLFSLSQPRFRPRRLDARNQNGLVRSAGFSEWSKTPQTHLRRTEFVDRHSTRRRPLRHHLAQPRLLSLSSAPLFSLSSSLLPRLLSSPAPPLFSLSFAPPLARRLSLCDGTRRR